MVVTTITSRTRPPTLTPCSSIADESTVPAMWTTAAAEAAEIAGGDPGVGRADAAALGVVVELAPVAAGTAGRDRGTPAPPEVAATAAWPPHATSAIADAASSAGARAALTAA